MCLTALLLAPVSACSCGEEPLTRVVIPDVGTIELDSGTIFPDAGFPDAITYPDAEPVDAGPERRVLTFDGTSPISLFFGATRDLHFTLKTVSGAVVPRETIHFALSGAGGTIGAMSAQTDTQGGAVVRFTAGSTAGRATVTASADLAASVNAVLDVREDPAAQLTIDVASTARIHVGSADALVYVGATPPSCATLRAAATLPTPTFNATFSAVPGSSTFSNQTSGAHVTVIATGEGPTGAVVARGCTDGVRLAGGQNTHVRVTLEQLPPNLAGDYDTLLHLDLGETIPPPVGDTVVLITDLLSDPAGWIVYQTLAEFDRQLGTTFVQWNPPGGGSSREATFVEVRDHASVFNVWRIARGAVDNLLESQFGQSYDDLKTVGGDIAHVIRAFEVGAGYTVTSSGTPNRVEVVETWKALVFQWQRGCPAGDLGCARRAIELSGAHANLAPTEAAYGATVTYAPRVSPAEPERYALALDAHAINIRYGAIVLLLLDELVFPNLPPPLGGNSLSDVLGNVVDCASVATSLSSASGLPAALFEGVCDTAVMAAANYVEGRILALDSANNPDLVSGLDPSGGGNLVLVDLDQDLTTELVESATTSVSWTSGSNVTTPITGAGRRRAAHCAVDADCPAGLLCVPIGSYLEVKALENDCRRPVGTVAGARVCTQDSDCASGRCFDTPVSTKVCFSACTGTGACTVGTCTPDVASFDLDPIMAGLGDATAAACLP